MGCTPSNTFDQPLPIPPLQDNSHTSNYFHTPNSLSCPTDNPPPYTPQPLSGHKSISLPQSESVIPFRGWGERPSNAWSASNAPHETCREQQHLQSQVQFLQHFITILQQESAERAYPLAAIEPVESLGDIDELDQLPPLNHNSNTTQLPVHAPSFPPLPYFPSPVLPHTDLTPFRLAPIVAQDAETLAERVHGPEEEQCTHSERSQSRKKRRKKRRRHASVAPAPVSLEYPVLTLQRPFTSPNLTATLARPLGSNQTFF